LSTERQCGFWPKNKQGQPKEDYGKLSVHELSPRINLADPNHRTKVLGKHLYPLTTLRKDSGKQLSKPMAERLKLNFGKGLHQNRGKPPNELRNGLMASLEHEFGNHEYCSAVWCKWLKANDDIGRNALYTRWMNKVDNKVLYDTLLEIYRNFLTTDRIKQMHHPFDTQKNEALNTKIARCCPKNTTMSKSMVLSDRVSWVVVEDSVGGEAAVVRVFEWLGLGTVPEYLQSYYQKNDSRRAREHEFKSQPKVKYRRRKATHDKIQAERSNAEESRKKGQAYGSGIAFLGKKSIKNPPKTVDRQTAVCSSCGLAGHQRVTSKKCLLYKIFLCSLKEVNAKKTNDIGEEEGSQMVTKPPISMVKEEDQSGD